MISVNTLLRSFGSVGFLVTLNQSLSDVKDNSRHSELYFNSQGCRKNGCFASVSFCTLVFQLSMGTTQKNCQMKRSEIKKVELGIDMNPTKRSRKALQRLVDFTVHDEAPSAHRDDDLITELKHAYKEVIDNIISSINKHFDQNDMKVVKDINRMVVSCTNNDIDITIENVMKYLGIAAKFVEVNLLAEELKSLPIYLSISS